jgi:hypothetical protein
MLARAPETEHTIYSLAYVYKCTTSVAALLQLCCTEHTTYSLARTCVHMYYICTHMLPETEDYICTHMLPVTEHTALPCHALPSSSRAQAYLSMRTRIEYICTQMLARTPETEHTALPRAALFTLALALVGTEHHAMRL